jgi:hypothetical protein
MTTKSNLEGLTVKQIKDAYPNGTYKSKMLRNDVIKEALASVKPVKEAQSSGHTEPAYGRSKG